MKSVIAAFDIRRIFESFSQHPYYKDLDLSSIDWEAWFHAPGMPPYTPAFDTSLAQPCADLKDKWVAWDIASASPFTPADVADFTSGQKIEFLAQLVELEPSLSASAVGAMEEAYGLAASTNSEIKFRWIRLGLRARYEPAVDLAVQMVTEQGRMKFLRYTLRLRIFD